MEETIKMPEVTNAPSANKPKKKKSKARSIIEWILFGFFGLACAFIVAGLIDGEVHKKENYGQSIRFGIGSFIVLTNSMEPEIPQDSAIITYKEEAKTVQKRFEKGAKVDITFFNTTSIYTAGFVPDDPTLNTPIRTDRVMTHRLREFHVNPDAEVGKGRYIFVTTGINTGGEQSLEGQYQVFTENEYLGTVKVTNVFLGKVFNFIVSAWGLIIMLLVPAAYLIVVSTIDIFKKLKEAEAEEAAAKADAPEGGKLASANAEERERLKKELLDEMINSKKEGKKNDE